MNPYEQNKRVTECFNGRVPAKIIYQDPPEIMGHMSALGMTGRGKRGQIFVTLPSALTAYERHIRLHEADHARELAGNKRYNLKSRWLKKLRKLDAPDMHKAQVANLLEDIVLGRLPAWSQRNVGAKRDAAVAGFKALPRSFPKSSKGNVEHCNLLILHIVRALELILLADIKRATKKATENRLHGLLNAAFGEPRGNELYAILVSVKRPTDKQLIDLLMSVPRP